jgi:hypothetical protein
VLPGAVLVLVMAAWVLAAAGPAAAVGPFGPAATVVSAGCNFEFVTGDAVVGSDGTTRGFVSFIGGSCGDNPQIRYFQGSGSTWTTAVSPYRGRVLGVAWDGTSTFLLHLDGPNIRITKRDGSGFTPGRVLSGHGSTGGTIPSGDVIALNGDWWAVWNEQVGGGGEFAQTDLFQARTIGPDSGRTRITFVASLDDRNPTLTLAPSRTGQAFMEWVRADIARGEVSTIRFAEAFPGTGWTSRAYTPSNRFSEAPDLFLYGGSVFGTYLQNNQVIQATNPPLGLVTNSFGFGSEPHIGSSGGKTWVAWTGTSEHLFVGEATAPGVRTQVDLTPGAGPQQAIAVTGRSGKATVFGVSFQTDRLYAKTQT